eukprot:5652755-Amphidinium_carterae.1
MSPASRCPHSAWFFLILAYCLRSTHGQDTCQDLNAALTVISWKLICPNIRAGLIGLSCDLSFGRACPVSCGFCETFQMSYTCSAQEVYDNKLELAKFLQQMEVCPDCEPPPLNNSYTVRYQVSSADAVPWAQVPVGTWTTEYAHDPCSVPGITCDRCGAAITVALGFPNAAPITGRLTSSMPNLPLIESFFIASTLPTPEDAEMPQDVANFPRLQQLFFGGVVKGNLPDLSQAPMISAVRFVNTEMTGNPNNFFGAPTMLSINVDQSGLASNAGFDWTPMSDKICQTARITEFRMASVNLYGPVP